MGNIRNQFFDSFPLRIYASHRKFRCRQILRQTVFQRRLPRLIKCGLGKGAVYRRLKHIGKSIHHLFLPVSEEKCCCKHTPVSLHGNKGNWQILKRILDGKPVIIPGDGSSLWTLTHSKDFAKGYVGLMANPHAIGNAFHITTDESMTWNQIYQTIADALGKPLNALHVASDFLARHGGNYDFRGELLGDKAATVVFDNSKIKRLVPDFICTTSMADGLRQSVQYMLSHPETQTPDPEFDSWCDRVADAMAAADRAFEAE